MKTKFNILLASCLFALSSCNSFLEEMPDDRTIIDSPEKIGELLAFAYPDQNHQMFCYAMSDNATDKGKSGRKSPINEDAYKWQDFRLTSQDTPDSYWSSCYSAIKQANHALAAIEIAKVDGKIPEEIKAFYGEALIARAYCHFMLVNLWSPTYDPTTAGSDLGIPYVTESEETVLVQYSRGTVAEVYEKIEKDIVEGIQYVSDEAYDNKSLHWNYAAAHTFAARFYSVKGDFDKVLEHTNLVLPANPAESLRDLNGAYSSMDINEAIIQWGKTEEKTNLLVVPQYSNWFVYFYGSYRYAMSGAFQNYVYRKSFVDAEWIWEIYGSDPDVFIVKWGYHTEKQGLNSEIGYYMIMNVLVDMEEALLLRMEANAMKKSYEAVHTDMNTYLSKRLKGYDTDEHQVSYEKIEAEYRESEEYALKPFYELDEKQRVYLNCLYDIRRKEYYYTGMRWFDQKRFNTRVRHYYSDGRTEYLESKDVRKQLQIPFGAQSQGIEANPR